VVSSEPPRLSIVFPCLNEEEAIGACVRRARAAIDAVGGAGEVVVADNGSTDRSAEIARAEGARVLREDRRGYGAACHRAMLEAHGRSVILLDADDTYPVEDAPAFVALLEDGADFVMGNRFGKPMDRRAMPFLNRYVGNPILSGMTRLLFHARLRDIHCGMRAIRRDRLESLDLRTPGMEFATEMVVKALDRDLDVREVAISYRPRVGESKLNPLGDAWRHIEYMLAFSPAVLLLWPGLLLFLGGLAIQIVLLSGPRAVFFRTWDFHTNLAGLTSSLVGATLLLLGVVAAAFAASIGIRFRYSATARWVVRAGPVWLRVAGSVMALIGAGMWLILVAQWLATGFGNLAAVPYLSFATTLLGAGGEFLVAAFLVQVIGLAPAAMRARQPAG
jgi:glycosyltransferase involved in cell wall biosynthesis